MEPSNELRQALKEYKEGKSEAFTTLYEESSKYVYTCIYKVMSGNDNAQDIINDIMQDTYVEISKYITQLEDEEKFLSWAGTIATRKCYAYLKKNKKYVLLNEEDNTFENLSDSDSIIPEEVLQDREKQRLVREIIETQLTEMQKLCIIAYYYNEKKQSEIAEELGIPENTVKTNLSRAKAKIKDGVLDLEKREGTKLYSVAPFLLLLFKEEVQAAVVPKEVTESIMSAVSDLAGAGAASKGIIGKIASASLKTKIIAGVVAVGVLGGVAGTVYVVGQSNDSIEREFLENDFQESDIQENEMWESDFWESGFLENESVENDTQESKLSENEVWENDYKNFLLNLDDAVGFDLNDFDEDGIPELLIKEESGTLSVYEYNYGVNSGEVERVFEAEEKRTFDYNGIQEEYISKFGYGMNCSEIVELIEWTGIYNGEIFQFPAVQKHQYDGAFFLEGSASAYVDYRIDNTDIRYSVSIDGNEESVSKEEWNDYIQKVEAEFIEITYTNISSEDIDIRFKEFNTYGNR